MALNMAAQNRTTPIGLADDGLMSSLAPVQRLALAYAPARVRPLWLGLLALDARLAGLVAGTSEILLGQIKLAWWRDRLGEPADKWPKGEPLLAALAAWRGGHAPLVALVDGWEAVLGERALAELADGRAAACAALAELAGLADYAAEAARLGRGWAIADLANFPADPADADVLFALAAAHDWRPARLPRELRPLVVMHGLAARQRLSPQAGGIGALFSGIRLGILGR